MINDRVEKLPIRPKRSEKVIFERPKLTTVLLKLVTKESRRGKVDSIRLPCDVDKLSIDSLIRDRYSPLPLMEILQESINCLGFILRVEIEDDML